MTTTRCPNCFTDLKNRSDVTYTCVGSCGDVTNQRYGTATIKRVIPLQSPGQGALPPASVECGTCHIETHTMICPECWYVLPEGWYRSLTTCIAMAGARATGKSFYIAVMRRQLERIFELAGEPFDFADERTKDAFWKRYEGPVFKQRNLLEATRPDSDATDERIPLIFNAGSIGDWPHRLVIRDVAGEDMESRDDLDSYRFAFFANADAVIFLIDPLRVESIRIMLEGLVPQTKRLGADPQNVLAKLLRKIKENPAAATRPVVCVTLSKFDVLQELREVQGSEWSYIMKNQGAAFLRDPSLKAPAYDEADGRLLHEETRSLLQRLGANTLVNQVVASQLGYRLFTVSALGQHGEGDKIHPRGISPFRCADPMKWVLARAGALPVTDVEAA